MCTPLTWAPLTTQDQQRVYIDWAYRCCLPWQGEMLEERCTSWLRSSPENYSPQYDNEHERKPTDDIVRLSSPWLGSLKVPLIAAGGLKDALKVPNTSTFPPCAASSRTTPLRRPSCRRRKAKKKYGRQGRRLRCCPTRARKPLRIRAGENHGQQDAEGRGSKLATQAAARRKEDDGHARGTEEGGPSTIAVTNGRGAYEAASR